MRCSELSNRITYTAPFRIIRDLTPTFLNLGIQGDFFVLGRDNYEGKDSYGQNVKIVESDTVTKQALGQHHELDLYSYENDGVNNVFPKLYEYVKRVNPDVILASTPLFAEIFALRELKEKSKVPMINFCGSTPVKRQISNGSVVSGWEFLAENKGIFDSHVAISSCTRKYLAECGIDAKVIYAGVNPDEYTRDNMPNGKKIVLYSGRFCHDKGVDLIPDIIQRVLKRKGDAKFRISGYGPMHKELEKKLKSFNGNVSLKTLEDGELKAAYKTSHTYFKPSRANEAFCISVVEAMATGNNIVYSGLESIALQEIVGDVGRSIAELNSELYAEEIIDSLENGHVNKAAIDRVREKFDIRKKAKEWEMLLKNL